MDDYEIEEWND